MWFQFRPYVPVAQRRAQASREVEKRRKNGKNPSPVVIEGRKITNTFWGQAWCDNLESYSDFENRLPRGRTYVRNGSVVDLQIEAAKIKALVSGSALYDVNITITPLSTQDWQSIKSRCAGKIGSIVDLLQGKLPKEAIEVVTAHEGGLFPKPREIKMSCSCPDYAGMCKHVAAVMYGVGARLDKRPDLLFKLRKVDHLELIEQAVAATGKTTTTKKKTLAAEDVADVFGIDLTGTDTTTEERTTKPKAKKVTKSKASRSTRAKKG